MKQAKHLDVILNVLLVFFVLTLKFIYQYKVEKQFKVIKSHQFLARFILLNIKKIVIIIL